MARGPDPLAFSSWQFAGGGRFDDPAGYFRVIYAAEQLVGAFIEVLARFRRPIHELAVPAQTVESQDRAAIVPPSWLQRRLVGTLRLDPGQRWLDVGTGTTQQLLRQTLVAQLQALGLEDLDAADVMSRNRQLTQAISRWAYEQGYRGIRYHSRLDTRFACWAIFEGAGFTVASPPRPIRTDDGAFLEAMGILGLSVEHTESD